MKDLIVIKADIPIDHSIMDELARATGAMVGVLPMGCTITTKEDAVEELSTYKEALEQFCVEK